MAQKLQHITDLAEILFAHGVEDVVISPGSRNAPLIRAFYKRFGEKCLSLVDERSAAYFALGQSLVTRKPTVLISTSGTAILNYAPAIAEAFYQQVPLLVLTADRPAEWIGQQDNQAMQQEKIYRNYIKASYSLPVESSNDDDLWMAYRTINEAFSKTTSGNFGPVHINIPLREPLYESLPEPTENISVLQKEKLESMLPENSLLRKDWQKAGAIMLVCGQLLPDKNLKETVDKLAADSRVVVVAEPLANLGNEIGLTNPEVILNSKIQYPKEAIPELAIYFGGQVVSKKIKLFLRELKNTKFWFISSGEQLIDTFQNISGHIQAEPLSVLRSLNAQSTGTDSAFKKFWKKEKQNATFLTEKYNREIAYSDLKVFSQLSETLPYDAIVFAGNSSIVRYLLYFSQKQRTYYSNRGVSGIDGCLSSAAGLASKTEKPVFVIVGDLAFTYDSNALWNRGLPKNLKIILVNNEGGGIFHLLKGPSQNEAFLPLVNAHHPVDFKKLSEAFGLNYNLCESENELKSSIQKSCKNSDEAEILEIRTPNNGEPQITKDFFKFLNANYGKKMDNA
ncbi:2-succinyl-5-enolpyruvyl-6-hydroxy-3-cyclohexene-1-carboxylic-acid synthase [Maribellus maritimus]|uniref:2-succinyl-5-enolpyruvyl-6-hydroxy-3- cyclohexene-1-carboxylic-acid synthase n=1 Tax=Maribellus maritimus TaxID=2870838 RepID=UPI001EEBD438|nr:2-succinyl-5-enolpyruvyl-6-hydroxy-3-cyclohexene-1-carboxylic-acid synthase [Maribellus maritimus]MCG6189771.1 2-succinyl-5-enolpyruvyl-6-hydroxy-3-cyclohexene-1-carboxylic-acid synthase [Maribellus maritimus]